MRPINEFHRRKIEPPSMTPWNSFELERRCRVYIRLPKKQESCRRLESSAIGLSMHRLQSIFFHWTSLIQHQNNVTQVARPAKHRLVVLIYYKRYDWTNLSDWDLHCVFKNISQWDIIGTVQQSWWLGICIRCWAFDEIVANIFVILDFLIFVFWDYSDDRFAIFFEIEQVRFGLKSGPTNMPPHVPLICLRPVPV